MHLIPDNALIFILGLSLHWLRGEIGWQSMRQAEENQNWELCVWYIFRGAQDTKGARWKTRFWMPKLCSGSSNSHLAVWENTGWLWVQSSSNQKANVLQQRLHVFTINRAFKGVSLTRPRQEPEVSERTSTTRGHHKGRKELARDQGRLVPVGTMLDEEETNGSKGELVENYGFGLRLGANGYRSRTQIRKLIITSQFYETLLVNSSRQKKCGSRDQYSLKVTEGLLLGSWGALIIEVGKMRYKKKSIGQGAWLSQYFSSCHSCWHRFLNKVQNELSEPHLSCTYRCLYT